jgi:CHAT domain-containing protein
MFSSLLMADGKLTVYDLERLTRVPQTLVLPACDAAVSGVKAGDELIGLSAALLGMGVRTLVLPQVPIPDAATRALMSAFHRELRSGATATDALAGAVAGLPDEDARMLAVRRSFVVLGA